MLVVFAFGGVGVGLAEAATFTPYDTTGWPEKRNPRPAIYSINPNPIDVGSGSVVITVRGNDFVEGAVAKFGNYDRSTYFLDRTQLSVKLLSNDVARVGDYVITVYNPGPGGGGSNSYVLSVVNQVSANTTPSSSVNRTSSGTSSGSRSTTTTTRNVEQETDENDNQKGEVRGDEDENPSDLAAGALFGSGGFFPGSLVGWLILIILILLLIIIIRRMYGAEKKYHDTPLKHA